MRPYAPSRSFRPSGLALSSVPIALAALLLAVPAMAGVEVLDFEDQEPGNGGGPSLTEEYTALGVHFDSSDDANVWNGLSGGDPGGWQVEGSNGPRFLGFDGESYNVVLTFDAPVQDFQLDVARAAPHPYTFHQVWVVGLREGEIVDEQMVYLGAVDSWMTVALAGELDQVVVDGPGQVGTRFAIDNVQWLGPDRDVPDEPQDPGVPDEPQVPEEIEVRVDVRNGKWLRFWTRGRRAIAPVVLHGDEDFDVTRVAVDSLALEPGPAKIKHRSCPHFLDLDRDGYLDMFVHFRVRPSVVETEGDRVCLVGETVSGESFSGCDELTWWNPRKQWRHPRYDGKRPRKGNGPR